MKFLVDQNLSHRLINLLQADFPGSAHVRELGLERSDDQAIWEFAKNERFVILSKDADFHQLSFVHGHPPKVVWLRVGNASTQRIMEVLKSSIQHLNDFNADQDASFLVIN